MHMQIVMSLESVLCLLFYVTVSMYVFQRMVIGVLGNQKEHAPRHVVEEKYGRQESVNVQRLKREENHVQDHQRNLGHVMKILVRVSQDR